ncbi:hypothetical protein IWW48_000535 [Coemansia sp. RSA 1200]|nr:hypothetical protein IWW48_000535 [Coemansia sp. RSA 1200]
MEAVYSSSLTTGTPDVWQQLQEFRFGVSLPKLFDYIAFLPVAWETSSATLEAQGTTDTSTPHKGQNNRQFGSAALPLQSGAAAAAGEALAAASKVSGRSSIGVLPTTEGTQLFGFFVSPYFLFSIFIGFVISRIHVLVHRQRVRPLGMLARIAIYSPAYFLLLRAFAIDCIALSTSSLRQYIHMWMETPVDLVSSFVQNHGIVAGDSPIAASRALWLSFSTCCIFDCIDVFVARLEGSPCAPYEYIGGLVERTSLYYFYGGSFRIQELGLLHVLEKLFLSHILIVFENGWRWRLVPTAIANALMLHHFVFSVRNYTSHHSVYPFVQVLSMALLAVSMVIVSTTVLVHWLASTIDRLGMKPVANAQPRRVDGMSESAGVAVYDHNGVFQGTGAGEMDDSAEMFELRKDTFIPFAPDLRRDFSVEILDLAGTCLQQCSSKIEANGFSRPLGAVRLPRTTALDQYVDQVVCESTVPRKNKQNRKRRTETSKRGRGISQNRIARMPRVNGLDVFVDDEPNLLRQMPGNTIDLVHALQNTRVNSVRNLLRGMLALAVAIFRYALRQKSDPCLAGGRLIPGSALGGIDNETGQRIRVKQKQSRTQGTRLRGDSSSGASMAGDTPTSVGGNGCAPDHLEDALYSWTDSDDEDFDYVASSGETSEFSDDNEESDINDRTDDALYCEATDLVDDILRDKDDNNPAGLSTSAATFIARSLFSRNEQHYSQRGMMTRRMMYSRDLEDDGDGAEESRRHMSAPLLFNAMARMFRAASSPADYGRPALPFGHHETDELAQLIRSRRQRHNDLAFSSSTAAGASGGSASSNGGSDAALCVVCWANTRCVMLRPCRCLCLCNECRVALVARNFDHCPCCRRDVAGYSRVYAVHAKPADSGKITGTNTGVGQSQHARTATVGRRHSVAERDDFADISREEIVLEDPVAPISAPPSVPATSTARAPAGNSGNRSNNPEESFVMKARNNVTKPVAAPAAAAAAAVERSPVIKANVGAIGKQTVSVNPSKDVVASQHKSILSADKEKPLVAEQTQKEPTLVNTDDPGNNAQRLPESAATSHSAEDWRTRTLNYDPNNPGYDSRTEKEAIAPHLKAIVGDKIGYARRQRALEILYEQCKKTPDIVSAMEETPSAAARHAIEREKHVYESSVAGTYHAKLLVCLKELKQKAKA